MNSVFQDTVFIERNFRVNQILFGLEENVLFLFMDVFGMDMIVLKGYESLKVTESIGFQRSNETDNEIHQISHLCNQSIGRFLLFGNAKSQTKHF